MGIVQSTRLVCDPNTPLEQLTARLPRFAVFDFAYAVLYVVLGSYRASTLSEQLQDDDRWNSLFLATIALRFLLALFFTVDGTLIFIALEPLKRGNSSWWNANYIVNSITLVTQLIYIVVDIELHVGILSGEAEFITLIVFILILGLKVLKVYVMFAIGARAMREGSTPKLGEPVL